MTATTNPTYAAALAYDAEGFRVIPIHSAHNGICSCKDGRGCPEKMTGKHPVRLDWQKANQPGDPAMRNWWDNDKPKNIGIATGKDSGGLLVVDVDGDAGIASMKKLTEEHGREWLETRRHKTGGGGWHFLFKMADTEEVGNSAGTKLGKGIDTRGNGGYIIAPPSVSKKGPYATSDPTKAILAAPEWLLERLRPKEREVVAETPDVLPTDDSPEGRRLAGYTKGAVEHEIGRLLALHHDGPESTYMGAPWDITTFEVACNLLQLANADWAPYTANDALRDILTNAPRDPGFDDVRIHAKIDSATKTVGHEPAAYPPKPLDLLDHFAGSDLNVQPPATFSQDEQAPEVNDDGFVSNVGEPEVAPSVEVAVLEGIPLLHDRLDPGHEQRALADQLGKRYKTGTEAEIKHIDIVVNLDNIIDRPDAHGSDVRGLGPLREWIKDNLRSSTPETLMEALGAVVAGTDTDGPTLVFKGGGPILAALAATLNPRIGDEPESMLLGPKISTRDVDGPHIVFAFDDEPCPDFEPLALIASLRKAKAGTPLPPAAEDDDELEVRLPDYRAVLLERTRLGLAPKRREGVIDDAS